MNNFIARVRAFMLLSLLLVVAACSNSSGAPQLVPAEVVESYSVDEDSQLTVSDPAVNGFNNLQIDVSQGELSITNTGSFVYTPEPDYFGLDSFSYADSSGQIHTVNISVTAINDPPSGASDTLSTAHGLSLSRAAPGVLVNDTDVDGDALTATLASSTSQGTLTLNSDGSFSYTPDVGFNGQDSFSYTVSDGIATSEAIDVTIGLPNIILMMVDDMGQGDANVYNSGSAIMMPNLDALASAGMVFSNAHSASAVCSPSRYSLLTGNYPYRGVKPNGVWNPYDPNTMIVPGQQTLGHAMQSANYRTLFIGKLHNGGAYWDETGSNFTAVPANIDFSRSFDRGPTQFGFDYSFLLPGGLGGAPYAYFENELMVRYDELTGDFLPFQTAAEARTHLQSLAGRQSFNGGAIGGGGLAMDNYDSRHAGPILTSKALEAIDDHLQQNDANGIVRPFFLYMATPEPHTPWTPPAVFNAADPMAVELGGEGAIIENATPISARTDTVFETDVILGTLVAKLDDEGLLDNTLIIFTSDNGVNPLGTQSGYSGAGQRIETGPEGDKHINAQGVVEGVPLRGYKSLIYEGGHKVPLLMRWGDGSAENSVIPPGTDSSQLLGLQDMMATLSNLIGIDLADMHAKDSADFRDVVLGARTDDDPVRDHMIVQSSVALAGQGGMDRAFYQRDSNDQLWKLIVNSQISDPLQNMQFFRLYNLTADPGETNDLFNNSDAQGQRATMTNDYLTLLNQSRTIN